jgi:hypothetical protein
LIINYILLDNKITYMKLITIISFLLFFSAKGNATIYTFHTAGSYSELTNWDVYPGTELFTSDTISIEANCSAIGLFAIDGYLVFSENVLDISIIDLYTSDDNQIEFLNDYFQIHINGYFTNNSNKPIKIPTYAFIEIYSCGYGLYSNTCPI